MFLTKGRLITVTQMGIWALFLTITTLAESTKSALLKNAHIRFASGNINTPDKIQIASSSLVMNASITIFYLLIMLLGGNKIANLLNTDIELAKMFWGFAPGMVAMIFFSHLEAIQQSHFDFKGVFAGNFIRQLLFFGICAIHFLFKIPVSLYHLSVYMSLSIICGTFVLLFFSRKYIYFKFSPSKKWIRSLTGYGGFVFGSSVLSTVSTNLEQFFTAAILTPTMPQSVAYYNTAKRINGFIDLPTYSAAEVAFPKLSQAFSENNENVKNIYSKMVSLLLCFIIPGSIIVIAFPAFFVKILAGEDYMMSAPLLQIYMLISVLGVFQHQAATTIDSTGQTKLTFLINLLSFLIKIGLTYLLLVNIGYYGAVLGTLISSVISVCLWVVVMQKKTGFAIGEIPSTMLFYYKLFYQKVNSFFKK